MSGRMVEAHGSARSGPKARVFWSVLILFVVADAVTKYFAHIWLRPRHVPREVVGDVFRLTLNYNPGAAFGMYLGAHSRWIFLGLALAVLALLGSMYAQTRPDDRLRALALGLVCGGAVGNVLNRLWSAEGVVDFLDVGVGRSRWPTFNVADVGVTVGAILLAWVLRREDREEASARAR